ncbi:MAG: NAD(P)H-dependent glycerol-3-phosphate dehydrogenase [Bacilli bacterium]|nr:NAD(P)H-dependent glycerol-3-phosphate dehydrogenase [Bacilli bacterium]
MNILILGAGAYGLALANILIDKNNVTVYSIIEHEINDLKQTYKNEKLFPNIELSKKINFTNDINNAIKNIDLIIIAIPTNYIEDTIQLLKNKISNNAKICIASKGINDDTNKFAYDIVEYTLKTKNISILSGPSFAIDTIEKETIILTLAGNNLNEVKDIFPSDYIKIETTNDIIGVELSGTLKNIFAIACGILEGINASESTKASFLTNVISETKNLIVEFGGNQDTIFCSSGIGDIILTCSSKKSRNFTLGYLIGQNTDKNKIDEYLNKTTVEGLDALLSIKKLLVEQNINNELINLIHDIVNNHTEPNSLLKYIVK